jgi:hypothetical protein
VTECSSTLPTRPTIPPPHSSTLGRKSMHDVEPTGLPTSVGGSARAAIAPALVWVAQAWSSSARIAPFSDRQRRSGDGVRRPGRSSSHTSALSGPLHRSRVASLSSHPAESPARLRLHPTFLSSPPQLSSSDSPLRPHPCRADGAFDVDELPFLSRSAGSPSC